MSMSMPDEPATRQNRAQLQRAITRNVKVLMAVKDLTRGDLAPVLGIGIDGVNHKFTGRARWSLDDLLALAELGGSNWPITRFCVDPNAAPSVQKSHVVRRTERRQRRPRVIPGAAPETERPGLHLAYSA